MLGKRLVPLALVLAASPAFAGSMSLTSTATLCDAFDWQCCWAQGVWLLQAQAAEPHGCIVSVEQVPWSRVKSIYRE